MPIHYFLNKLIEEYKKQAMQAAFSIKDVLYRVLGALLITSLILWLSVFLYASFYYSYMPVMSHTRPVHFMFSSCKDGAGLCSHPQATVTLTTKRQILMDGQPYKIYLDLEMPESDVNRKLGMFMVHMDLQDSSGKTVKSSRKLTMLKYKSWLLRTLSTMFFSPLLLAGPMEEKQTLSVEMFNSFEEDAVNPVTVVRIEIESKWIQLYSASLRLQAHFVGLRYIMFHWPVLSAVVGITTNASFLFFLVGCVWYRLFRTSQVVVRVGYPLSNGGSRLVRSATSPIALAPAIATVEPQPGSPNKTLEQRRIEAREKLLRDRQKKVVTLQVTSEQSTESPERLRSLSVGSLQRIEEVSAGGSPVTENDSSASIENDEGLIMAPVSPQPIRYQASSMELRHRTHAAPSDGL